MCDTLSSGVFPPDDYAQTTPSPSSIPSSQDSEWDNSLATLPPFSIGFDTWELGIFSGYHSDAAILPFFSYGAHMLQLILHAQAGDVARKQMHAVEAYALGHEEERLLERAVTQAWEGTNLLDALAQGKAQVTALADTFGDENTVLEVHVAGLQGEQVWVNNRSTVGRYMCSFAFTPSRVSSASACLGRLTHMQ
ncbi:hypothetical protein DFH07DRAFT_776684 [Mycena maculata]|uniref:Uncharacterized protein n=1 Tax=Mycena maculata TaxID=230809 RepID=A0AAD7ILH5_9AGAR|nr:hypothetical protein DFH07DRAFT_776684 [Mycena maculata]